ncbi:hypothetical protein SAMN05421771_0333 [Granulicella pectinivorans]|jgi:hypothetical protein|uniref:Uncharacterized protein n=1 Tax=Granulicella pectinivorans TaxID=474950 RepID=A0A1I6L6H7_9BACT|nr:hypothetical protein [Granulicella pectinivorans]SFR99047.1 hypothetical protein SAMN05421771_0333 [Granulicella pectinivorans]
MSVREGMQNRRRAGKVCGITFLLCFCTAAALHVVRLQAVPPDPNGIRLLQMETIAIWLALVLASALMLIVAVELSIVAWRLLRSRHRN